MRKLHLDTDIGGFLGHFLTVAFLPAHGDSLHLRENGDVEF